jgi:septal ring factor EnvC (AmiA/AmiB activator)
MVSTLGIAEFIILVAVLVIAFIIIKLVVPHLISKSEQKQQAEIKSYKTLIEEVKAITESTNKSFGQFEDGLRKAQFEIAEVSIQIKESNIKSEQLIRTTEQQFEKLIVDLNENKKDLARLQVWDDRLDIWTRLDAGIAYLKAGGNHKTKQLIQRLAVENHEAWESVVNNSTEYYQHPTYFDESISWINKTVFDITKYKRDNDHNHLAMGLPEKNNTQ